MTSPEKLLSFSHVDAGYPHRPVLTDVNLDISRGDFIVLTGSNGGGKTTLVRLMLGLMRPTAGQLWRARHIVMGYQPQYQHIDRQFPITVEELVLTGLQNRLRPWQRFSDSHRRQVSQLLERFDLAAMSRQLVSQLSGGQLQRALFARAVVSEPDLLVRYIQTAEYEFATMNDAGRAANELYNSHLLLACQPLLPALCHWHSC